MRRRRRRNSNTLIFMASYALAFAVLCVFAFLAVAALRPREKTAAIRELSAYLPEPDDRRTLLLLFTDGSGEPVGCTLISLSAARREIPIATLPAQTRLNCLEREYTIAALFETGGIGRVNDAVEESFATTVDGCILFDPESLAAMTDAIGPLEFDMPFALAPVAGSGTAEIAKGAQRLTGRMTAELVTFPDYAGGEETRAKLISDLCEGYIEQYLPSVSGDAADRLFKSAISEVQTDISFRDFEGFRESLGFLAAEIRQPGGRRLVYTVSPDGVFDGDGFTLSNSFRRRMEGLM